MTPEEDKKAALRLAALKFACNRDEETAEELYFAALTLADTMVSLVLTESAEPTDSGGRRL